MIMFEKNAWAHKGCPEHVDAWAYRNVPLLGAVGRLPGDGGRLSSERYQ